MLDPDLIRLGFISGSQSISSRESTEIRELAAREMGRLSSLRPSSAPHFWARPRVDLEAAGHLLHEPWSLADPRPYCEFPLGCEPLALSSICNLNRGKEIEGLE